MTEPEFQAEIERLKAENSKLAKDLAGAHDDLKEVRAEARDRRHENKALAQQLVELTTERDTFKTASEADPENLRKEIDGYRSTIRSLKHERAFEVAAKALSVNDPAKLADLVKLANYVPDGDEPDPVRITTTFQEALKGRSWLIDQPASGDATTAPGGANGAKSETRPAVAGPGSDRGQSVASTTVSQADARPAGRL